MTHVDHSCSTTTSCVLCLDESLVKAAAEVKEINVANGWYDEAREFPTDIALLHSEVSEAFEAYRNGDNRNLTEEMADIFIRLLDSCDRLGVNLAFAFTAKCRKNRERDYRHGGKKV